MVGVQFDRMNTSISCNKEVKRIWLIFCKGTGHKTVRLIEKLILDYLNDPREKLQQIRRYKLEDKEKFQFKVDRDIWKAFSEHCEENSITRSQALTYLMKNFLAGIEPIKLKMPNLSEITEKYNILTEIEEFLDEMRDDINWAMRYPTSFIGDITHNIIEDKVNKLAEQGIEHKGLIKILERLEERGEFVANKEMLNDWSPLKQTIDDYFFAVIEVELYRETHPKIVKEHPEYFEEGYVPRRDGILRDREKQKKKRELQGLGPIFDENGKVRTLKSRKERLNRKNKENKEDLNKKTNNQARAES